MIIILIPLMCLFIGCKGNKSNKDETVTMINYKRDKEFYALLAEFTISSIRDNIKEWDLAELNVDIQPGMVGLNGHYFLNNEKFWLEPRRTSVITKNIIDFHREMTKDGVSKWNKMIFKLQKDNKFESEFIWDSHQQE